MEKPKTTVIQQNCKWDRLGYIDIIGDEIVFDTSSEEYGPVYFLLEVLEQKIKEHKEKLL